uniref:Cytochrome P450 n=1 Tax=Anopheles christyi TaxID=43041 RepID=A0A3F2YTZ4_9DIPT
MRQMFTMIVECCENMVLALAHPTGQECEVKDLFVRFKNDIIASCAFGVRIKSFLDKQNVFFRYGKDLTDFGRLKVFLKMMGYQMFPTLMAWLEIDIFDRKHVQFFTDLFRRSFQEREQHGLCLIFFLAGFDTIATLMSFIVYEVTMTPEIQHRLYDEILQVSEALDGKSLTYDALQGMHYLDMVVSETLRKWPPAPSTDRQCNQDFMVTDERDNVEIIISKGGTVSIPIAGQHHDPKFYLDPDRFDPEQVKAIVYHLLLNFEFKRTDRTPVPVQLAKGFTPLRVENGIHRFDPERFNDENKHKIPLGAYLPFGIGPRNCIASRFALMEVKAIVYHLLLHYEFTRSERTPVPLKLAKGFISMKAEKGIYLHLSPRNAE